MSRLDLSGIFAPLIRSAVPSALALSVLLLLGSETGIAGDGAPDLHPYAMPDLSLHPPDPPGHARGSAGPPAAASVGTTLQEGEYLSVDVLLVVYTHSVLDTVTSGQIDQLLEEIEEARRFYARNSGFRFNVRIADTAIISREQSLDQYWLVAPPGGYWLSFTEEDGVHSVRNDLYDLGYVDNQFAAVFVFYAWANTDTAYAAYGGGAYGVDVGFMGRTAYASVPFCWDPTTNDWLFVHEFHHQLDDMFRASGLPEYPHADRPQDYLGGYDDGYTFNAWMLRTWPKDNWAAMSASWGTLHTFVDGDLDSVPDFGPELALTEADLGSSPGLFDTDADGLDDLSEAMAHVLYGSDPNTIDTDGDGERDGIDRYPVDPHPTWIPRADVAMDGYADTELSRLGSFALPDSTDLTADYYMAHSDSGLYVTVAVYDDTIETPWDDPWWNDGIYVRLDAQSSGYWAEGDDNYFIRISPPVTGSFALARMSIIRDDGSEDTAWVPATDLLARGRRFPDHYEIEFILRPSVRTGLTTAAGGSVRMQLGLIDYDTYPGWPRYEMFTQFLSLDFVPCGGRRGDANCDDKITSTDIIYVVNYIFKSGAPPQPVRQSGDVDCDGRVVSGDIIALVNYVFKGGPAPCVEPKS